MCCTSGPHMRQVCWKKPAASEWVATKLRWQLADTDEIEALKLFADGPCEDAAVIYHPAP